MSYVFKTLEPEMLDFWKDAQIYDKSVKKNASGKRFYYLDGPPYTTGKIHIGHAWGKALRDSLLRYKRMAGFAVWDRPGFDMHGLPIEVSVEKELGIKDKKEIINKIGIQKFIEACQKYALDNLWPMIDDFKRIGVWLDWKNPYMTIRNEYIEGAWWALSKAEEKKLLYLGKKAMTWCPRCATALAKHELEYYSRKDPSLFVKLPLQNKDNEFLVVWTTTPWTLPFNMAVMAHPDVDYVKVQVGKEVWILAEALVESVVKDPHKIIETFKGIKLKGQKYVHPFKSEVKFHQELKEPNAHSVIFSKQYVSTDSGSGLVHCAPGCGGEDFEVGREFGVSAFNETDEHGCFLESMGSLAGLVAKQDDERFIQLVEDKGLLLKKGTINHDYAHCWRCKTPVIFRATDQWFLAVESLREEMREQNKSVHWQPNWAGSRQFDSWLASLRDWCISRQRFWGVPLPIWLCSCGKRKVIASRAELTKLTGKELENLHRPWIDHVVLKCDCGKDMHRVPDVLDVWLDSGVAPWATLNFPSDEKTFKELGFPDSILEGSDQVRGWFNSLTCMSMISFGKIPFKSVYMHGMINDALGRKMSKSLKNFITPYEITEVYGADTLRYYQIGGAGPGLDLNFNHDDAKTKHKNLGVLWNIHNFAIDLAKELKVNPAKLDAASMCSLFSLEERYMLSKLNSAIKKTTELFDDQRLNEIPSVVEDVFLTLSRSYIQMVRDKAALGDEDERKVVLYAVYTTLVNTLKLFAPIAPFITDKLWQTFKSEFGLAEESIHLCSWPVADKKLIDVQLEQDMDLADSVVQSILASRERAKISVRWPIKSVEVISSSDDVRRAVEHLSGIIKSQTNVKEVHAHGELVDVKVSVKPNPGPLGKGFGAKSPLIMREIPQLKAKDVLSAMAKDGTYALKVAAETFQLNKDHLIVEREVPKNYVESEFKQGFVYLNTERSSELEAQGYAREIMRRVQQLRKDANLKKVDKVHLFIQSEPVLVKMLHPHEQKIKEKCGAIELKLEDASVARKHGFSAEEKIKDYSVKFFLDPA